MPRFYDVDYLPDGRIQRVAPNRPGVPWRVSKHTVMDLDEWPYPKQPLVPLAESVHERMSVEIFRGCTRGCRFCQAGMITRPVRERSHPGHRRRWSRRAWPQRVSRRWACSACPAPTTPRSPTSTKQLADRYEGTNTGLSLPSTRVDAFNIDLANELSRNGRRSGLTFAPEGGSERIRKVINKMVTEDDLVRTVAAAYGSGWRQVKLYFMCGLPTETDEDVLQIAELAKRVIATGREVSGSRDIRCTVSIGGFVPKPHTPFQWAAQEHHETVDARLAKLRDAIRSRPPVRQGDRLPVPRRQARDRRGTALARRPPGRRASSARSGRTAAGSTAGASTSPSTAGWRCAEKALADEPVDVDWYTTRERDFTEVLPWDHLDSGLDKDWLWEDWQDAVSRGRGRGLPLDAVLRLRGLPAAGHADPDRPDRPTLLPMPPSADAGPTGDDPAPGRSGPVSPARSVRARRAVRPVGRGDPVAGFAGVVAVRLDVLQDAAAAFDDGGGADVRVVAGDQYPVQPEAVGIYQGLAQDRRRVAAAAIRRADAVADVPAVAQQEVVELVADRHPSDDVALAPARRGTSRRPCRPQVQAALLGRDPIEVGGPRLVGRELVQQEREPVVGELTLGQPGLRLVVGGEVAKDDDVRHRRYDRQGARPARQRDGRSAADQRLAPGRQRAARRGRRPRTAHHLGAGRRTHQAADPGPDHLHHHRVTRLQRPGTGEGRQQPRVAPRLGRLEPHDRTGELVPQGGRGDPLPGGVRRGERRRRGPRGRHRLPVQLDLEPLDAELEDAEIACEAGQGRHGQRERARRRAEPDALERVHDVPSGSSAT